VIKKPDLNKLNKKSYHESQQKVTRHNTKQHGRTNSKQPHLTLQYGQQNKPFNIAMNEIIRQLKAKYR